jgi:hypothetical protein
MRTKGQGVPMEVDKNDKGPKWKPWHKERDWDSCGSFHDKSWDDWGEGDFEDDWKPGPPPKELGNFNIADEYQTTNMTPKDEHQYTLIWLHGTGIVTNDARNAFSDERIDFPRHCKIVILKAMEDLSWHPVTDMGYWFEVANQEDE